MGRSSPAEIKGGHHEYPESSFIPDRRCLFRNGGGADTMHGVLRGAYHGTILRGHPGLFGRVRDARWRSTYLPRDRAINPDVA